MTTKTAAYPLSLTDVPCRLLHNQTEVTSHVILSRLDPKRNLFSIVHYLDPEDVSVSFTLSKEGVTVYVHQPEELTLATKPELERDLPPMTIVARHVTHDQVIYGHEGPSLAPPIAVTRSGSDTDLIIGLNFDGSSTTALPPPDGSYCELVWRVNSNPRSLRFAAAATGSGSGVPLILRPKREE